MNSTEVTFQLPKEEAEFLESYARERAASIAEIFTRHARRLHSTARRAPHPQNVKFTGSVLAEVNARETYRKGLVEKHQ